MALKQKESIARRVICTGELTRIPVDAPRLRALPDEIAGTLLIDAFRRRPLSDVPESQLAPFSFGLDHSNPFGFHSRFDLISADHQSRGHEDEVLYDKLSFGCQPQRIVVEEE